MAVYRDATSVCDERKKREYLAYLDATNNQLPQDRESLFWMNVKRFRQWINQN